MSPCVQKCAQGGFILLPRLPQQPSHRLLDEVMRVIQEYVGDSESVRGLSAAHESHGAHYAYPLLPYAPAVARKLVKHAPVLVAEPFSEQPVARQVHKVPVVDTLRMGKIKVYAALLCRRVPAGMREMLDKGKKPGQAKLVIPAHNALLKVCKVRIFPAGLDHAASDRNLDAEEQIPLSVLSGTRLEEA